MIPKINRHYLGILAIVVASCGQPAQNDAHITQSHKPKHTEMDTLRFIYVLTLLPEYQNESNWTEETNKIVSAHFNHLKQLKEAGQVILAGKTDYSLDNPLNFGIVIFNAKDLESARQFMNNDPAIQQKVMTAKLHPFSLALLINE